MHKPLALVFVTALVACLTIVAAIPLTKADAATRVVNVPASADIANVVNADSGTTATAFQLAPNATYRVNALIVLKAGDELRGAVGPTPTKVGPANDSDPTTKLTNGANLESLIALKGVMNFSPYTIASGHGYSKTIPQ